MSRRGPKSVIFVLCALMVTASAPLVGGVPSAYGYIDEEVSYVHSEAALDSLSVGQEVVDFFTENVGHVRDDRVRFYHSDSSMQIGFIDSAVLLKLFDKQSNSPGRSASDIDDRLTNGLRTAANSGVLVQMTFEGANLVEPQGRNLLPHRSHFFLGNNPSEWKTGVKNYEEVLYEDLYDGIDLIYRMGEEGLKYDFILEPGAEPRVISVAYQGIENLAIDLSGALAIQTEIGDLRDSAPTSFQSDGSEVECYYVITGPLSYGLSCEEWDTSQQLIIDPLIYSTYLGGERWDAVWDMALDSSGNVYVVGGTASTDFPTTTGAFDETHNGGDPYPWDAFVAKLSPDGSTLLYSTYLGGADYNDEPLQLCLDPQGNVLLTGFTYSPDFPTTQGAYDETHGGNGWTDGFLTKLNSDGSALIYSTFIGGSERDSGHSLTIDADGNAYVTGQTKSADFPTTPNAFDRSFNYGGNDAFVMKVNPDGSDLVYSTYLGGSEEDIGWSVTLDASRNAHVVGLTESVDFPTTAGAFDESQNRGSGGPFGNYDVFVTKLNSDGTDLIYSTFVGGSGDERTWASSILDSTGVVHVTGSTTSTETDFPITADAYDPTHNGGFDVFVFGLTEDGSDISYSTFLGGSEQDIGWGITLDSGEHPLVTGRTYSSNYPITPSAYDDSYNLEGDAFVSRIGSQGRQLMYSSFLGGGDEDSGYSLSVDSDLNIYIAGRTFSADFPTTSGAHDRVLSGLYDGFVTKIGEIDDPFEWVSVSGHKVDDFDGDGIWDTGEPGIQGWGITLWKLVPPTWVEIDSTSTDSTGYYSFLITEDGGYMVAEEHRAGWTHTSPSIVIFTAQSGQDETINFLNFADGSICGSKFYDDDHDGVWDAGEPSIEGWKIQLWREGFFVSQLLTDVNGDYCFNDLTNGQYEVREVMPLDPSPVHEWGQTYPGGDGIWHISMTSGTDFEDIDFGNVAEYINGLTWGYWETHTGYDGPSYDPTYDLLAGFPLQVDIIIPPPAGDGDNLVETACEAEYIFDGGGTVIPPCDGSGPPPNCEDQPSGKCRSLFRAQLLALHMNLLKFDGPPVGIGFGPCGDTFQEDLRMACQIYRYQGDSFSGMRVFEIYDFMVSKLNDGMIHDFMAWQVTIDRINNNGNQPPGSRVMVCPTRPVPSYP